MIFLNKNDKRRLFYNEIFIIFLFYELSQWLSERESQVKKLDKAVGQEFKSDIFQMIR